MTENSQNSENQMGENQMGENTDDIQTMSFEAALAELKMIVERLEQGEGKLDEAIGAYDRGAKLKAHCETKLREAQEKVEKITMGPDGQPRTEPFDVA